MFIIKTKHTFEVNFAIFIRKLEFHPECIPPHYSGYDDMLVNALNKSEHIFDRELAALETVERIVIRRDGGVLSAEVYGDTDYAQFRIVLNHTKDQKIGDIVS